MSKRQKSLLIALSLAAIGAAVALLTYDPEPTYNGRPLSFWIKYSYTSRSAFHDSEHALHSMGTNALPLLLNWIQYQAPSWPTAVARILPGSIARTSFIQSVMQAGENRAHDAIRAFTLLGTNAEPAIPQLALLMRDRTHPSAVNRAIEVLSGMRVPALPYLTNALSETNQLLRSEIVYYMSFFMAPDIGTNKCAPAIRAALSDPDPKTRQAAADAVAYLKIAEPTNVHTHVHIDGTPPSP